MDLHGIFDSDVSCALCSHFDVYGIDPASLRHNTFFKHTAIVDLHMERRFVMFSVSRAIVVLHI